jgi:hypothetical protein
MDTQRRIILYAWLAAAVLGIVIIFFSRLSYGRNQNLSQSIVGSWQAVGFDEKDQFRDDGTVSVQGQGKTGTLKYTVLDPNRLQFAFEGRQPRIYRGVSIRRDRLEMTNATSGQTVNYTRAAEVSPQTAQQALSQPKTNLESPSPLPSYQPRQ